MPTVSPIYELPANWPAFVEEGASELCRLFGPAYVQSYRKGITKYLQSALETGLVLGWKVGTEDYAHGICTSTITPIVGRVAWLHILEPHRMTGLEQPLLDSAISELKSRGCRRILVDFVPLARFELDNALVSLQFRAIRRELMIADSRSFPVDPALIAKASNRIMDEMAESLVATYARHPGRELHPETDTFTAARTFVAAVAAGEYGGRFPGHIQVARAGGKVAGFAIGASPGDGVAFLFHVAVAPEFQNRGYGGRLIRAFLHSAGAAGFARTALSVTSDNPARRLYDRLGFDSLCPVDVYSWSKPKGMPPVREAF